MSGQTTKNPARHSNSPEHSGGRQGFASMDQDRQREIASKGGKSVPDQERGFAKDRELAAEAGRKGGHGTAPADRNFSRDPDMAAEAGRKGGEASRGAHQPSVRQH